jgi:D-amino-acid oxidase
VGVTAHEPRRRLVLALGGSFSFRALSSLAEAAAPRDGVTPTLVVNCAALGAAELCGDASMQPVRGTLVLVRCPSVEHVYSDESWSGPALTYIVPKGGGVVACAGCAEPGATSLTVSADEAAAVLQRCVALLPALRDAPVLSTWAGLRPVRAAAAGGVRLELERRASTPVVHNYGHGGSGVVVSWGCAADVVQLAAAAAGAAAGALSPRRLPPDAACGLPPLTVAAARL